MNFKIALVALLSILLQGLVPMSSHAQQNTPAAEDVNAPEEEGSNAGEIRRGLRMGGQDGRSRTRIYFERLISGVEPDLIGKPDRLALYIRLFEREMVQDTRTFATNVSARWDEATETVHLEGYVNWEENKNSLNDLFSNLAFEKIQNDVEVLPSEGLGERLYAIVSAPHVFSFSQPAEPRERVTNALLGDHVYLLKEGEDGYFLCHTSEGYVGYVDGRAMVRMDKAAFADYRSGTRVVFKQNYRPTNVAAGADGDFFVPAGSRLKFGGEKADGRVRAILPDGSSLMVEEDAVFLKDETPDPRVAAAVEVAKSIIGTNYVWGGKTMEGVDCSGLVQSSFAAQGINLARDAYMQAYNGSLSATRWNRDGMRHGDLMYFLGRNGRITHTAIYLGDGIMVEASGEVKLTSLNPGDENYSAIRDRGFAFAKRIVE